MVFHLQPGRLLLILLAQASLLSPGQAETPLSELFEERLSTTVYVSFAIEREIDRQRGDAVGLVVDDAGLVVLLAPALPDWLPPDRLKDLRVHLPRSTDDGFTAEYLGMDPLNGSHYLRADEAARASLRPIGDFPTAEPAIGDELWGICLADENLDYLPYYRHGRLAASLPLPLMTGFLTADVATPGGPLFDRSGNFVGWSGVPQPMERQVWIGGELYQASVRNPDESHTFLHAREFHDNVPRVPPSVTGAPRPWLGASGLQPLDADTAEFLGLEDQGAVIISEVLAGGPAEKSGLENGDIVVAVDGERLPRMKPSPVVQVYFEREIQRRKAGDRIALMVVRGSEELEVVVELGRGPKLVREADYHYLESLGITLRELVHADALQRRVDPRQRVGVMTAFVRPNSPPAAAGLQPGDWILEIDGREVRDLGEGIAALEAVAERSREPEYVLLVSRNNETAVLRVRGD